MESDDQHEEYMRAFAVRIATYSDIEVGRLLTRLSGATRRAEGMDPTPGVQALLRTVRRQVDILYTEHCKRRDNRFRAPYEWNEIN